MSLFFQFFQFKNVANSNGSYFLMVVSLGSETSPKERSKRTESVRDFSAPHGTTLDKNLVEPPEGKIFGVRYIIDLSAAGQARRRRNFVFHSQMHHIIHREERMVSVFVFSPIFSAHTEEQNGP